MGIQFVDGIWIIYTLDRIQQETSKQTKLSQLKKLMVQLH
nr:MAG TPA: hypothetical protein [Caudoviricetes sp.]